MCAIEEGEAFDLSTVAIQEGEAINHMARCVFVPSHLHNKTNSDWLLALADPDMGREGVGI
jgi:hypothetical protein